MRRYYSPQTLKVLFGIGAECAHPDCHELLIEPGTAISEAIVAGQICHIYSHAEDGPRGRGGLSENDSRQPGNLILLCAHHHTIVDRQPETYTAEVLLEWKRVYEEQRGRSRSASGARAPTGVIDAEIDRALTDLRKLRFFADFRTIERALALGGRVVGGELSQGSDEARCRALAWCARVLALSEYSDRADQYLDEARQAGTLDDVTIAAAFVAAKAGGASSGLDVLGALNSPSKRSAGFMMVLNEQGFDSAATWLESNGLEFGDLDGDGKVLWARRAADQGLWDELNYYLSPLDDQAFSETPALLPWAARARLAQVVPVELREVATQHVPFESRQFPLAGDAQAIGLRRQATECFRQSQSFAVENGLERMASIERDFVLWLELRDPERNAAAMETLESGLRDPESSMRLVPLGLQFGVALDIGAIETRIERETAVSGVIGTDARCARLALAFAKRTPEQIAEYVGSHVDDLSLDFDRRTLQLMRVEMLIRGGCLGRAAGLLDEFVGAGELVSDEERLRQAIANSASDDPIDVLEARFRESDSISDLIQLGEALEGAGQWGRAADRASDLFQRTRSPSDAETLALRLYNAHRNVELVTWMEGEHEIRSQVDECQLLFAWGLFEEGRVAEAALELDRLPADTPLRSYRRLKVNLAVTTGDWDSLDGFVAAEATQMDARAADELLDVARLAVRTGSTRVGEILEAAVDKEPDDPFTLLGAYTLAVNAGLERSATISGWMQRAVEISGSDGPVESVSLEDLARRLPEWNKQATTTLGSLADGEIPLFLAAGALGRPLVDLIVSRAIVNQSASDRRSVVPIPAFAGRRGPVLLGIETPIALDSTAILTLALLGLLDLAIGKFSRVVLPHSSLRWLFDEDRQVSSVQPTRARDARALRDLLATGVVSRLVDSTGRDDALVEEVGHSLASLILESERRRSAGGGDCFVVQPGPIYRNGSLMNEEADLGDRGSSIVSCTAVAEALRDGGTLEIGEYQEALKYLALQEPSGADRQPVRSPSALLLGPLAVTYFQHLGLLEKLSGAGFEVFVSADALSEADELIQAETVRAKVKTVLDEARSSIHAGILSGHVHLAARRLDPALDQVDGGENPTRELFVLPDDVESVVVDDRFANQYPNFSRPSGEMVVSTTLDVIESLYRVGSLTDEERLRAKTVLRKSGYQCVPVEAEELSSLLGCSSVVESAVVVNAELRAIRESFLGVRASGWVLLPPDARWLENSINALGAALRDTWCSDLSTETKCARADWLFDLMDVRGWGHCARDEATQGALDELNERVLFALLAPPPGAGEGSIRDYFAWLERGVLGRVREMSPEIYGRLVDAKKEQIIAIVDSRSNGASSS